MLLQTASAATDPGFGIGQAVILGIVEGLTEFLPVSSTAHLILSARALGLVDTEFLKSFEIIIQFGAILSVVVLYWRKFWSIPLLMKLFVAFVPTAIVGLTVYRVAKTYLLGNVPVVLASLVLGGVILILFERRKQEVEAEANFAEITMKRAILIGLFQAIAIVPGVSRSAATIIGGSLIGVGKRTIVEFSFMLAVPTMLGASVLDLAKSYPTLAGNLPLLGVGFVVSFITALIAVAGFIRFVKQKVFAVFGVYRIVLAVAYFLAFDIDG